MFAEKPRINNKKCNRCGICINVCPVGAIDKKELKIDDNVCLRCFACVKKCPKESRKINFKKKGKGKKRTKDLFISRVRPSYNSRLATPTLRE